MAVGELAVNVTARTRRASKGINGFRKEVHKVGPAVDRVQKKLAVLPKRFAAIAAGAVSIGAITSGLKRAANEIDRTAKFSRRLGVLPEQLVGIQLAARQTAGVTEGSLNTAMQRMVRRVSEAADGTGEAQKALRELNLDARKLETLTADRQLFAIADKMAMVKKESDRLRLSVKLFDTEGAGLATTLAGGSKELSRFVKEAKRLNGTFTKEEAKKVEAMNDQLDRLKTTLGGAFQGITIELAPGVTNAIGSLVEAVRGFKLAAADIKGLGGNGKAGRKAASGFLDAVVPGFSLVKNQLGLGEDRSQSDRPTYGLLYNWLAKSGPGSLSGLSAEELNAKASRSPQQRVAQENSEAFNAQLSKLPTRLTDSLTDGSVAFTKGLARFETSLGEILTAPRREYLERLKGGLTFGALGKSTRPVLPARKQEEEPLRRNIGLQGSIGINSAIDARSAQGAAALRANIRGRGQVTLEKATKKTADNTDKMAAALNKLIAVAKNPPMFSIPTA